MKRKYLAWSLVIVLLIASSIIFYPQKPSIIVDECSSVALNERYNCYINIAVDNNDSIYCERIQDSEINMKELCYASVGSAKHNPTACEKIQNSDMKNQCLATAKNDTSFCENIQDENIKVYPCFS